jgi:hypothetical protein
MVKEKYPWLAMPCLIVKDEEGQEHEIALTPGPEAHVWWLDVLTNFHASYNWDFQDLAGDGAAASSIADPYATLHDEEDDENEDTLTVNPDFVAEQNRAKAEAKWLDDLNDERKKAEQQRIAEGQGFVHKEIAPHSGLSTTAESLSPPPASKPQRLVYPPENRRLGFFARIAASIRKFFNQE